MKRVLAKIQYVRASLINDVNLKCNELIKEVQRICPHKHEDGSSAIVTTRCNLGEYEGYETIRSCTICGAVLPVTSVAVEPPTGRQFGCTFDE